MYFIIPLSLQEWIISNSIRKFVVRTQFTYIRRWIPLPLMRTISTCFHSHIGLLFQSNCTYPISNLIIIQHRVSTSNWSGRVGSKWKFLVLFRMLLTYLGFFLLNICLSDGLNSAKKKNLMEFLEMRDLMKMWMNVLSIERECLTEDIGLKGIEASEHRLVLVLVLFFLFFFYKMKIHFPVEIVWKFAVM